MEEFEDITSVRPLKHPFVWVNWLVAGTNLVFWMPFHAAWKGQCYVLAGLCFFAAAASALYHLAERKHGLPGCLLPRFWRLLLWLDRIGAYLLFAALLHRAIWLVPTSHWPWPQVLVGFLCLAASELDAVLKGFPFLQPPPVAFAVLHGIWHLCAAWAAESLLLYPTRV